ncbi:hypothetical protein Tco_0063739, partial [Tanacetum coccineum]
GHHPPLSISKPGLHSVYKTVIDSMGHSGSWLSRSSSRTLWFLKLNGSLQPIKDDSLDV